jgi:hypothetical protein
VEDSKLTLKKQIICHMREVLKEQDNRAVGTGCERSARWGTSDSAGNSANAAATAVMVAKQVHFPLNLVHAFTNLPLLAIRRNDIFKKAKVPCLSEVKNARVTTLRPLRIDDYGIVFTDHGLRVAHGKHSTLFYSNGESQYLS